MGEDIYYELVESDDGFHGRVRSESNDLIVWFTPNYSDVRDAKHAIELIAGEVDWNQGITQKGDNVKRVDLRS